VNGKHVLCLDVSVSSLRQAQKTRWIAHKAIIESVTHPKAKANFLSLSASTKTRVLPEEAGRSSDTTNSMMAVTAIHAIKSPEDKGNCKPSPLYNVMPEADLGRPA